MAMLQFSMTLYTVTGRFILRPSRRFAASLTTSTSATPDLQNTDVKEIHDTLETKNNVNVKDTVRTKKINAMPKIQSNRVKLSIESQHSNALISKKIDSVTSVNELLNFLKIPDISQANVLKIMSNITNLINRGNSDVPNIQEDKRFINMQKILSGKKSKSFSEDNPRFELETLSQYSISTMVSEMLKLAENKNRNLPLLKFYSHQIIEYSSTLTPKSCVNLLFSMAVLSFPDEALLEKIVNDLSLSKDQIGSSSVSSIMWSIGRLRYKNERLLELLCDLVFEKNLLLKTPQLNAIAQTFAILGCRSEKTNAVIEHVLLPLKLNNLWPSEWINYVWSLVILDRAKHEHLEAVLNKVFIEQQLKDTNLTKRLKLLNINAAAQYLVKDYKGTLLDEKLEIFNTHIEDSKEKEVLVNILHETLTAIFSNSSNFLRNVNSKMGFTIDAVCYMDSNFNIVNVDDSDIKSNDITRIAILLHHFNYYTRGKKDLLGLQKLRIKLLQAKGFRVLPISYEHLSAEDKLIKRAKYLKEQINLLKNKPSK